MAFQEMKVRLIGELPGLILHNCQLADPTAEATIALKELTVVKKNKDFEQIALKEWWGGLYLDDKKEKVILPGYVVEGCLKSGARKSRAGIIVQAKCMIFDPWSLDYAGPKNLEQRSRDPECRIVASVVVNGKRIMRTRPFFRQWFAEGGILFEEEDGITYRQLEKYLQDAGQCGMCDWRPRYGRFKVEVLNKKELEQASKAKKV